MFVPPRHNPWMVRIADLALPLAAQFMGNIRDVHIPDEDFQHLEALRHHRAILTPNHPTGNDPFVPFFLSRRLKQPFHYLAAREILVGVKGWVMNQVGAYSVIRGIADRQSIRTTRALLAEHDKKVVIFPEGEIYEHNDHLLAFQGGVAQIGFWALDDLVKLGKEPRLPILPIAFKYRCCESPRTAIDNSLRDLEAALQLPHAKLTSYERLRRIGDGILKALEKDLDVKAPADADMQTRIVLYRRHVLEDVARAIGATLDDSQPPADQLHLLFHQLKSWVGELPPEHHDYEARLYRRRVEVAAPIFSDLTRIQNFIAFTADYVATEPSAERFLDVLGRLEKEVLGEVRHPVPRQVLVRIAPPIALHDRYEGYRRNKREMVVSVTREMEETIRGMLRELAKQATPMALDT